MVSIQRILCPVDFSEFSEKAYEYAAALANRYKAELSALHVIERVVIPNAHYCPPEILDKIFEDLTRRAENRLREFSSQHYSNGLSVHFTVRTGFVAETILDLAEHGRADLIVLGTHGRRGWDRLALGSVAEKILRKAPCPVLAIRRPAHDFVNASSSRDPVELKRILFCSDFSTNSGLALGYAVSLASEFGAQLTLLHVLEHLPTKPDIEAAEADVICRLENTISREVRQRCATRSIVRVGKAYEQIVQLAFESNADLVVMGVLGRNAADLALFGSTTHRVLQLGLCPVLVVPPKARAAFQKQVPNAAVINTPAEIQRSGANTGPAL